MPREPLETVRAMYAAWNADEWEAARACLHPEVEWRTSGLFPGFEPVYHGHDGVRAFWDSMKEAWKYFTIDIEQSFAQGHSVVLGVRFEAAGKESGVRVDLRFAHVWEVRDGLVVQYSSHPELKQALEVAGLTSDAA